MLFIIAIWHDSLKVAMNIYLRKLTSSDILKTDLDTFMQCLKRSPRYHEMKFFFIHQYFDLMDILQLNKLVDILTEILHVKDIKKNPVIHQYNTIKYSLLIYRVGWKIKRKKLYSLITKVSIINSYLHRSLTKFFDKQSHIA